MRSLDLTSIVVAGLLGLALLAGIQALAGQTDSTSMIKNGGIGFAVGAGVQIGVRLIGVS